MDPRSKVHERRSVSATWGTTAAERDMPFPCDGLVASPDAMLYRGVTIEASQPLAFRWLCQLRVAPYSYDCIDNWGRRSPRHLIDGLDNLAVGQDVVGSFMRRCLPWGDLVMMRRQLLNLKSLMEHSRPSAGQAAGKFA
jgi:hypothetical protein